VSHDRRDVSAGDGVNALAGGRKQGERGEQAEQGEQAVAAHQLLFDFSFTSVITR
jgi:hypothetical protein